MELAENGSLKINIDNYSGPLDVLLDLANSKIDGFLAIRTDGTATSMVLGSESVMKNISEGKIQVDGEHFGFINEAKTLYENALQKAINN